MLDEEKKAIDYYTINEYSFGFEIDCDIESFKKAIGIEETDEDTFEKHQIRFKTLLNLIEKQRKQIENLKEINKEHQKINGELRDEIKRQGNTREIEEKYIEENFISKDKIREKIKELDEKWHVLYRDSEVKDILKELLKEE